MDEAEEEAEDLIWDVRRGMRKNKKDEKRRDEKKEQTENTWYTCCSPGAEAGLAR